VNVMAESNRFSNNIPEVDLRKKSLEAIWTRDYRCCRGLVGEDAQNASDCQIDLILVQRNIQSCINCSGVIPLIASNSTPSFRANKYAAIASSTSK
jgi:hypothetical protein